MIIDVHHHLNNVHYRDLNEYLDDLVRISEEYGVDRFCCSGLGEFYGNFDNSDVEQAFRRLPDKVVGFGFVEVDVAEPGIVSEFHDRGFKGIKLIRPVRDYDDEAYMPFYEQIARYRMPVLLHTGIVGRTAADATKKVSSARMRPIFLETIARRFPELSLVGAHLGHPWFDEAVAVMTYNENVFFDITGISSEYIPDTRQFFREKLVKEPPYEKLVFGTDSLARDFAIPYEQQQSFLEELGLDASVRQKVMGGNVDRMLRAVAS